MLRLSVVVALISFAAPAAADEAVGVVSRTVSDTVGEDAAAHRTFLSPTAVVAPVGSVGGDVRGWPSPFVGSVGVTYVPRPRLEIGAVVGLDDSEFPSRSGIGGTIRYQAARSGERAVAIYGAAAAHAGSSTDGNPAYGGRVVVAAGVVGSWCVAECAALLDLHAGLIPHNGYADEDDWQVRVLGGGAAIIGRRLKLVLDATVTNGVFDDGHFDGLNVVGYGGVRVASRGVAVDVGAFLSTYEGYHEALAGFSPAIGLSFRN